MRWNAPRSAARYTAAALLMPLYAVMAVAILAYDAAFPPRSTSTYPSTWAQMMKDVWYDMTDPHR